MYAVAGPGVWLLLGLGLITARIRMGKLQAARVGLPEGATPPTVAVVIPAHNEAAGIRDCLTSVLAMTYRGGAFRVIAVDDRSTDGTAEAMDELARFDPRLTVVRLNTKPNDWLGKCNALREGMARVPEEVEWGLFIDSDVKVRPGAMEETLGMALRRKADAVSILTRQRCDTFFEKLLTPIGCAAILAMYAASLTNQDNRRRSAFANGQFFLIRRSVYEQVGGHAAVRDHPVEDVALMRLLKASGAKCRLYSGDHLAETRMYDSLGRMFKGWGRIYSGASGRRPWRILLGSGVVVSGLAAFLAVPVALVGGAGLAGWQVGLTVVHLLAVVGCVAAVYRWSGNSPLLAVLFPLAAVFQLAFYGYALWWCFTNRMEWRGTAYSAPGRESAPGR